MNETISNLLGAASDRTVSINGPDGQPMVRLQLIHAAGLAAAAVGALFKGVSLSVEAAAEDPA